MPTKIEIAAYSDAWIPAFEKERQLLATHLQGLHPQIEHIGSTAVKGLGAKPVIDIMVGLPAGEALALSVAPLTELGYCYYRCYESAMPERRFFARLKNLPGQAFEKETQLPERDLFPPTHHIHMVIHGSSFWKRHLAFRDYLRTHPMARDAYHRMKVKLANGTWESSNDYAEAKTGFIRSIERLMGLGGG